MWHSTALFFVVAIVAAFSGVIAAHVARRLQLSRPTAIGVAFASSWIVTTIVEATKVVGLLKDPDVIIGTLFMGFVAAAIASPITILSWYLTKRRIERSV